MPRPKRFVPLAYRQGHSSKTGGILRSADTSIPNTHAHPVSEQIGRPAARKHWQINWRVASGILFYHLLALLAFVPGFFSWTGSRSPRGCISSARSASISVTTGCWLIGASAARCGSSTVWRSLACAVCRTRPPAGWRSIGSTISTRTKPPDPHSPAGEFSVEPYRLADGREPRTLALAVYRALRQGLLRDPSICASKTTRSGSWIERSWVVFFVAGFLTGSGGGTGRSGLRSDRHELSGVGRVRADRGRLAHHLVGEFRDARCGATATIETDDDSRNNSLVGLSAWQWRRVAQQPSRRSRARHPRPSLVGVRWNSIMRSEVLHWWVWLRISWVESLDTCWQATAAAGMLRSNDQQDLRG